MTNQRLRLALISPKGPLYRHRGGIFGRSLRYMPLTLPTLAALVPSELNAEITSIDEGIQEVDVDLDVDLVGMTVITGTAPRAYALAAEFRKRGRTVVLGGPHVTLVPDDAQPHADAVVVGYAEDEWPRLLRDYVNGKLKTRYVQAPGLDLANRPLPRRDVLPRRRYVTSKVFEATRGCIHNCSFCVVPFAWGRKPLQKPVDDIVKDIREQRARRAIFIDLNLIADKHYATQLFEALVPLNVQWYGLATTLLCDDVPLLDLAARSGCRGLLMGLESVNRDNLQASHKAFNNPNEYERVVRMLHERRIALQGCFMFGLDGDTRATFRETAQLAVDIKIDLPRFAIVTPYPGTSLFEQLDQAGRILTRDWALYDGQHAVFAPASMTPAQLEAGTQEAWKFAYRWTSIAKRLRHTGAPWYVALASNLGYRFYARRLHKFYSCDWPLANAAFPRIDRSPQPAMAHTS